MKAIVIGAGIGGLMRQWRSNSRGSTATSMKR